MKTITVSWFSAGVSSAVATKLMIDKIDKIIYIQVDDQHRDTMRFVKDCEKWFGKEVEIIKSPLGTVENALRMRAYVNGPNGSPCTGLLKIRTRLTWESEHRFFCNFRYIWGFDNNEVKRAKRREAEQWEDFHSFPLIENNLSKADAHGILKKAGIKRPAMYDLGYPNNNCIGCVKGGMGYWNKIRVDFPEVFKKRSEMERLIGGTCIKGVYLDELDPDRGRDQKIILPDCGDFCEGLV